ncbi:alpha/beta fold hydrolase [Arthrobacter mangrovi]|uniref:Alpha/beta hydrolase n=1 Tax=Arthrobacter mangrovi TaxID=2966350 RepID=A0ABQ5MV08_9MICC|nr:alpha/beta hydrolase [Arthrobacter mangrovi]GLB67768.1 alpha/beta hydrolase [Arthrobacter mangrovi]
MPEAENPADRTSIAYDITGEGPAVVLLHGSALSRAMWRGLGYVGALAGDFTVVRIDLRGHGRSGKPHDTESYRMPLVVGDVLAVLDAEGIASAAVAGYSFGARVGFALAAAAPERVDRFATLGGTYRAQQGQVARIFFDGYLEELRRGGMEGFVNGLEAAGKVLDPATRAAFMANDPQALAAYFERTEEEPGLAEAQLASLAMPGLLMAGTEDTTRFDDSRRAAALMPGARFVPLPGRTHASTLFPADEVLAELVPFLGARQAVA